MEKSENSDSNEASEVQAIAKSVEKTMADFLESMRLREELSIKIGRRTSQIIRVGSFTVSLLSLAIVYLTSSLNTDMGRMAVRMDEIAITMQSMNTSVTSMNTSIDGISTTMTLMNTSISSVPAMSAAVHNMTRDINEMTRQMHFLNGNVGVMGHDVNRMSAPMKMFPFP